MTASFNPIQSGDVTQNLRESFTFSNRGMARIDQMNRQNQAAILQGAGKQWEKLAELSPKVGQFVGQKLQERENAKKAQLHTWWLVNKGKGLEEERKNYENAKNEMRDEYQALSAIVDPDDTMPAYLKKRFKDFSKYELNILDEIALKDAASRYNPSTDPQIQNSVTREEYEAGLAAYTQKFYEQFGNLDQAMVYNNVTVKVLEARTHSLDKWTKRREKEINAQSIGHAKDAATIGFKNGVTIAEQEKNLAEGEEAITGSTYRDFFAKTLGLYGGNKAKVREEFKSHMDAIIKSGGGTYSAIEALGEEMHEGYALKDHPQISHIIKKLGQEQMSYENKAYKVKIENQKTVWQKINVDSVEEVRSGNVPTEELYEYLGKAIVQVEELGGDATTLKKMQSDVVEVDGKSLAEWNRIAQEYADGGMLTEYQLNRMPVQLQMVPELRRIARLQTAARVDIKTANDAIENDVKHSIDRNSMVLHASEVQQLVTDMQKRMQELGNEYAIIGEASPYRKAQKEVMDWFYNQKKSAKVNGKNVQFISTRGVRFDSFNQIAPSSKEHNNILQQLDTQYNILDSQDQVLTFKVFNPDGTPADHTPWFHRTELEDLKKKMGKPGWIPDAKVMYLSRKTGFDYGTVINEQLKVLGSDELPDSNALDAYASLNDISKSLLNQSDTEEQDSRALGTWYQDLDQEVDGVGWNSTITYQGLGDQVWQASQDNEQPPHTIAAMIDLITTYPDINIDKEGNLTSPTVLAPELYGELMLSRWKHSGGTDMFALRELQRPGIK